MLQNEKWIITDEDGRVYGRVQSPYYSAAMHLAETFWPELVGTARAWPWMEASHSQRHEAKKLPVYTAETLERLQLAGEAAERRHTAETVSELIQWARNRRVAAHKRVGVGR